MYCRFLVSLPKSVFVSFCRFFSFLYGCVWTITLFTKRVWHCGICVVIKRLFIVCHHHQCLNSGWKFSQKIQWWHLTFETSFGIMKSTLLHEKEAEIDLNKDVPKHLYFKSTFSRWFGQLYCCPFIQLKVSLKRSFH